MLSQRHRIAIRRHLSVPFAGTAQAGRLFGWRFIIHVEDLEYKMSNLQPSEEQLITGKSMASWQIGDPPQLGDVLTFSIHDPGGTTVTVPYTVTSQDLNPRANIVNPAEAAPTFSIAMNASQGINQSAAAALGYSAVGVMPADLFSPAYMPPYFAEVLVTGPSAALFTIGATVSGRTRFIVNDQGAQSPIAATISNKQVFGYTALLDALGMGMADADLSLWLRKAGKVEFRPDEVSARRRLYRQYVEMLSRDMGGKEYADIMGGGGGGGAVA